MNNAMTLNLLEFQNIEKMRFLLPIITMMTIMN